MEHKPFVVAVAPKQESGLPPDSSASASVAADSDAISAEVVVKTKEAAASPPPPPSPSRAAVERFFSTCQTFPTFLVGGFYLVCVEVNTDVMKRN